MQTIVVAAPKGGCGKTTLVISLAVHAHHSGKQVAIVDLNSDQHNLQDWAAARGDKPGPTIVKGRGGLKKPLADLEARGFDTVFVDTPPMLDESNIIEGAISRATVVLIPSRDSSFDVGAVAAVVDICQEHGKPYAFVRMAVNESSKAWKALGEEATEVLQSFGGKLFKAHTKYHSSYPSAAGVGMSAAELVRGKTGEEAGQIWVETLLLAKGVRV